MFDLPTTLKIAGVLVLYHPDTQVVNRIQTYLPYIDWLLIVDNSTRPNPAIQAFCANTPNTAYRFMGANVGVARALNIGAEYALEKECTFLLTMDQDSRFTEESIRQLLSVARSVSLSTTGIITPFHAVKQIQPPANIPLQEVLFCMTSGNLVNLRAYRQAGGFMDELFIDHVDHEYCLRLQTHGYNIIQVNQAVMEHQLGETRMVAVAGLQLFTFITHSPLRGYYMIRNGLHVARLYKQKYPQFVRRNFSLISKEIIKVLVWEDKKLYRLQLMYQGYKDYWSNRLGSFSSQ